MTRFTDGHRTALIEMQVWHNDNCSPDLSQDILADAIHGFSFEHDAYLVNDLDWLVDYANEWLNHTGDFYYDDPAEKRLLTIGWTYPEEKEV